MNGEETKWLEQFEKRITGEIQAVREQITIRHGFFLENYQKSCEDIENNTKAIRMNCEATRINCDAIKANNEAIKENNKSILANKGLVLLTRKETSFFRLIQRHAFKSILIFGLIILISSSICVHYNITLQSIWEFFKEIKHIL